MSKGLSKVIYKFSIPTIGKNRQITFTAFEPSLVPFFNIIMPNPKVNVCDKTGHTTRIFSNSNGDCYKVLSNRDQNDFWTIYKAEKNSQIPQISARNPQSSSNQELLQACQTIKSFFNRGSVIQSINLETENPEETSKYFISKGLLKGVEPNSVSFDENSPFCFRFISQDQIKDSYKNQDALVSSIDHTVFNVYKKSLDLLSTVLPETFWGGDPRDLRAPGVQFYTRVLTSDIKKVPQMVPINNLDESEEELLIRIQNNDTFVPPYIADAVMGNQISRGLFDTNRTQPSPSFNGFLQHIAMAVNQKYGDIADHLFNLKKLGVQLIPSPSEAYYKLTEIDIAQRVVIPTLLGLEGIDAWDLPYQMYNGLLKPRQCDILRIQAILEENNLNQKDIEKALNAVKQMIPVFEYIGNFIENNQILDFKQFNNGLTQVLKTAKYNASKEIVNQIVELVKFNNKKVQKALEVGSLIDFQIISERCQSGYLDQTFTTPVQIQTEGTSGIFFEFIVRTCYDDIFELIKLNSIKFNTTEFKSCGAFGQGNFPNLMIGQQQGISDADRKRIEDAKKSNLGQFNLPLNDLETIKNNPLQHLKDHIGKCKERGETFKVQPLNKIIQNLDATIKEAKNRNLW